AAGGRRRSPGHPAQRERAGRGCPPAGRVVDARAPRRRPRAGRRPPRPPAVVGPVGSRPRPAQERTAQRAARRTPGRGDAPVKRRGWIRRLWPFLARHKRTVFIAFGVSLGTTLITVVIPLIERAVIDNVIVTPKHALWPLLALLIGLGALNFL